MAGLCEGGNEPAGSLKASKQVANGVDWKERRLFSNLYMKRVKVRIAEEMSEESEIGRGVRQAYPLSPILFNIYLEDLLKKCFSGHGKSDSRRKKNKVHQIC
ncbi:hypothetical protein ANN_26365 [Periplaneta americana]|uniref:Reverse transcriptase domain-containing protein n=1 Tax=Periplaneta americana TaxID=6978 RepID=A0ABQ8RXV5_PERAM|nr:hypothetical protein ANN_26365 [Periplaneta americana]